MKFLNNGSDTQLEMFLVKKDVKGNSGDVEELAETVEELADTVEELTEKVEILEDQGVKTYHINSSAWEWEVSAGTPLYVKIAKPEGFNASKILFATYLKKLQSGHETGLLVQSSLQDAKSWSWRIDLVSGELVVVWPSNYSPDYAPTVTFVSTL